MKINKHILLTVGSIAGVVGTGVISSIFSVKAHEAIKKTDAKHIKEKIKISWKYHIPAIVIGGLTVGSILYSHKITVKEIAGMTATIGYLTTQRDKLNTALKEAVGEEKYEEIKKQVFSDNVKYIYAEPTGKGDQLCFESYLGRWFLSTPEEVQKAQNRINDYIKKGLYASMNDFYDCLGIEVSYSGDDFGWVPDEEYYSECVAEIGFKNSYLDMGEGKEHVYVIEYNNPPIPDYLYF